MHIFSNHINVVTTHLFCIFLCFWISDAEEQSASISAIDVHNAPPALLTNPLIILTPDLLKEGLWGSCSVEVALDSSGNIDSCSIEPSGNNRFDSLLFASLKNSHFSPAIENNKQVSSIVNFRVALPFDSLINKCQSFPANYRGIVWDTLHKCGIANARLLIHYNDTAEDSNIRIGFNRYMTEISKSSNIAYKNGLVETTTDSKGCFWLKLLPIGHISLSVQASGYEIGQFHDEIKRDTNNTYRYTLTMSTQPDNDTTYQIQVYGKRDLTENDIAIAEKEIKSGFSPFISNLIQSIPEVRRVPEGPSKLLVRSGCPFDNRYVIAGIPMLAPFHFGGHTYADIDGLMISALTDLKVSINDIAAKRLDASGCIIEANPGRIQYDNSNVNSGIYVKGDMSVAGADLMAAYTAKQNQNNYLQIGYSFSDGFILRWYHASQYKSTARGNQGIGIPLSYGNATLTGSNKIGKIRYTGFGWFAWDNYNVDKTVDLEAKKLRDQLSYLDKSDPVYFPWGMGSIRLTYDSSNASVTLGGARQFFGTGKQFQSDVITTRVYLTNEELNVYLDTIVCKPFVMKLTARVNHDEWNGYLLRENHDTLFSKLDVVNKETGLQVNSDFIKTSGPFSAEVNLLGSCINYENKKSELQFIGDAGFSLKYNGNCYGAGIYTGLVTSRPDIRGLPDSDFRKQLNHSYLLSIPNYINYGVISKLSIEPYIRYSDHAPQLDPLNQIWAPQKSSPLLAYGSDIQLNCKLWSFSELSTVVNVANTQRQDKNNQPFTYEWDLPWTVRTGLHLFSRNELLHVYADYIITKGLPYYDFSNQAYAHLPLYRTLNLNFQIKMKLAPQQFINKLDCYVMLQNVQDLLKASNVRDYYWDTFGSKREVYLGTGRLDVGARFGIRI
jgi:hypothetical protein